MSNKPLKTMPAVSDDGMTSLFGIKLKIVPDTTGLEPSGQRCEHIEFNRANAATITVSTGGVLVGYMIAFMLAAVLAYRIIPNPFFVLIAALTAVVLGLSGVVFYVWMSWRAFSNATTAEALLRYLIVAFVAGLFSPLIVAAFGVGFWVSANKKKLAKLQPTFDRFCDEMQPSRA